MDRNKEQKLLHSDCIFSNPQTKLTMIVSSCNKFKKETRLEEASFQALFNEILIF